MIKQRFTLYVSLAFLLLMWALPHGASAQTPVLKCTGGMKNLNDVKVHIGCGDWFDVAFKGHPGFTYKLSIEANKSAAIPLGTFSGGDGAYSSGTAASKFSAGDTISIVQSCDYNTSSDSIHNDIFLAVLPNDLSMAGTWTFVPVGTAGTTNTAWFANQYTSTSPTDVPSLKVTGDNGRTWAPTCMGHTDGQWTFGAKVGDLTTYSKLDSLKYILKSPLSGSGTITSGKTITLNGFKAGDVAANIIAYSGSCTDTVMVMNVVRDGTNEPTIACNDLINVSVDATCMAEIDPAMILAGKSNQCGSTLMDSLVLKHANGNVVDVRRISNSDTIVLQNASDYIHGHQLKIELHSSNTEVTNFCWGNIIFEDKLAPALTCGDIKLVKCYEFSGTSTDSVKVSDCDPKPKINIVNERIITDCNVINPTSQPDSVFKRIVRSYTATDKWGNTTNYTCTDTLDILRIDSKVGNKDTLDIEGLRLPKHYLFNNDLANTADTSAFVCDTRRPFADADHDHIPDPVPVSEGGAGVPSINGKFELHPSNWQKVHPNVSKLLESCKTIVTYTDQKLPRVGCVEKVRRTWEFREFVCRQETYYRFTQFIEIVDSVGPEFKVPANMKVSTNLKTCERYMNIPPVTDVIDFCKKSEPTRTIVNAFDSLGMSIGSLTTENKTFGTTGGFLNLPIGKNTIVYHVFDDCHNVSLDTMFITVVDETAPVAICKEFLTVGIADEGPTGQGEVWLKASAFDNGSYDDCGLKSMCIARMDDIAAFDALEQANIGGRENEDPDGRWWVPLDQLNTGCERKFPASDTINGVLVIYKDDLCTPQMMICCNDVGKSVMVVFRVEDKSGNRNECMAEFEAQDKRVPIVHCPPDLTIDCRFDYPSDSLLSIFGNVVMQGQQKAINIPSKYLIDQEKGKDLVDGVWFGNCTASVAVSVVDSVNECRQGVIIRTFTVTSNNGNTTKCKQRITVSRKNAIKSDDIKYPADISMTGCLDPASLIPDSTGYPTLDEEECSLIGWAYEDLTVRFNDNDTTACFKIIREWTVIDWCKQPSFTIGTGTQIIKVNDNVAPEIRGNENGKCAAQTFSLLDPECKGGKVSLRQVASDDCTDSANLLWSVRIDIENNGSFDMNLTATGDTADVSRVLPFGEHRISWEVNDQCGNIDVCEQIVTINNIKKPTPICLTNITGSLMPTDNGDSQNKQPNDDVAQDNVADGGMLTVWAAEYDLGSSVHPCNYKLVYSFDSTSIVASKDFTCADLNKDANGAVQRTPISMPVYVLAVEKNDNKKVVSFDYCSVILELEDTNNTCDSIVQNPASVLISGNVHTEANDNVPTVEIELGGANNGASTLETETDLGGMYAFGNMPTGGTYNIVPKLNKDVLNGVSTLDLVLIQKHILGLERLGSPYKIIAGDVNKDGNISAIDLVELRRLILGLNDKFSSNESWRFVDEKYEFINPSNPLNEPFTENYKIFGLANTMVIDFVGVKVGDVNGNVNVSGLLTAPRSTAALVVEDASFEAGENVRVPVSFKGVNDVIGYQFTMEYDQSTLKFAGFESGSLNMKSENFGIQGINEGFITSSWGSVDAKSVDNEEAFVLEFTALSKGTLSNTLEVSSSVTTSEVYNENSEVMGLGLEFSSKAAEKVAGYELFQNTPNPFTETTSIGFMLAKDADATINIFDVTGKLVKAYSGSFEQGLNTITIDKSDISTKGVLYYTLDTQEFTSTRRMVLID